MNTQSLITLLLICLPFMGGCSLLSNDADDTAESVPFVTLKNEYVMDGRALETLIIRSESEEEAFLASHPQDSLPDVDYAHQIVIGVLAGTRPNSSYGISIDSVKSASTVVVYSTETGSATGYDVITHPAHIVALERSEVEGRDIEFAETQRVCKVTPCWPYE